MKLDRSIAIPLHSQIHAFLRQNILSNRLKSDENIRSERELAEEFAVSRMTVRQALNALRNEGLIYQRRGKGTFVSSRKLDVHSRNLNGFSDEMRRRDLTPKSKVLQLQEKPAEQETAEKLNLEIGETVFKLERLRLADDLPMAIETTCLPAKLFPDLSKYDFEKQSLYKILERNYGFQMSSAAEDLEAAISDAKTSELLNVKKNSPLLIVYRTVFAEDNQPIEYTKSIYRADRYRASFFLVKK
ncbi:MAG: GntR family transcriptional regulator [Pyrinomonadaceae bacterium]|nr:GntR family transcriptional regulator [Pyrinomonadaceae bacterium]